MTGEHVALEAICARPRRGPDAPGVAVLRPLSVGAARRMAGPAPMITLQQAYDTAVIPDGATAAEATRVIGVQGGLWTELMPSFARDQHALFPRIAALSEARVVAGERA